jgi:hypothetical protein
MAAPDFYAEHPLSFVHGAEAPIVLGENQTLKIEGRAAGHITLDALTFRTSNYFNTSTGSLAAQLCAGEICARGETDMATADDGKLILIRLDSALTINAGAVFTLEIQKRGKTSAVIWTYPHAENAAGMRILEAPGAVTPGYNIELGLIPQARPKPVHASKSMAFFELEDVRAYAAAPDCRITLRSHDDMEVNCSRPSQLTRLNVFMNGWRARVNGADAPIRLAEDTFQVIDLPEGSAQVSFRYSPPWFGAALAAAGAALLLIVVGLALPAVRRRQNSADAAGALT